MNEVCVKFDSIENNNASRKYDKLPNEFCSLVGYLSLDLYFFSSRTHTNHVNLIVTL